MLSQQVCTQPKGSHRSVTCAKVARCISWIAVLKAQSGLPQGESPGVWPLMGELRHSKAWLEPIHGHLSNTLASPPMPALSRQGSQVPLLQLHKLAPQVNVLALLLSHSPLTTLPLLLHKRMQAPAGCRPGRSSVYMATRG